MIVHSLVQGSDLWHAHRATHFNASDAAAMMGCSSYETRNQLLHRIKTGITPEVDAGTQRLFDRGHALEAFARPLAVEIVGEDLYPITGTNGRYSASFDGLVMDESTGWECKSLNEELRKVMPEGETPANNVTLPMMYRVQMEHQCLVSGAEKELFTATDGTDTRHCWYRQDPELQVQIIAGWEQFAIDLAAYVPVEAAPVAAPKFVGSLPVVFDMRVEGRMVACNLEQYKPVALAYIAAINTKLETDQHFADANADAKFCRDSADKLELAIEQALGQMGDINTAINTVREIAAAFDAKGLALEKAVKTEKDSRKVAIITAGRTALGKHEATLQERTQHHLPPTLQNFETVCKGLKSIASIQNAVDTELARCKIEANAEADKIQANLKTLADLGHPELFADIGRLVLKAPDDLLAVAKSRVADHQAKEAARIEADRERIRQEEIDRLAREQAEAAAVKAAADATAKAQTVPTPQAVPFSAVVAVMPTAVRAAMEPVEEPAFVYSVTPVPAAEQIIVAPKASAVRQELNGRLDLLDDGDLKRVLSFVMSRFYAGQTA
jgi:putative phage-type endonuclease